MGFVPIRKKGKLPFTTVQESYELEYGSATVEMHTDAVKPGDRVVLIDDLIATGGTMMAGRRLLERLGAQVIEGAAIVDLPELGGSATAARHRAGAVHAGGLRGALSRAAQAARGGAGPRSLVRPPAPARR
jgi:adenine phosphoribosyltransferase